MTQEEIVQKLESLRDYIGESEAADAIVDDLIVAVQNLSVNG